MEIDIEKLKAQAKNFGEFAKLLLDGEVKSEIPPELLQAYERRERKKNRKKLSERGKKILKIALAVGAVSIAVTSMVIGVVMFTAMYY